MKKLAYLLFALPMLFMASCDDSDDLPDVDVTVSIDGAVKVNDVLYVLQGETLSVKSVNIVDHTDKGAVIGSANYYWDYFHLGGTIVPPYGIDISTEGIPAGNHLSQIDISVYAVDYAPCKGFIAYKVVIVPTPDDIPEVGDQDRNPNISVPIRQSDDD